jgi:predicted ATP-dependent endonuclease of OLD family
LFSPASTKISYRNDKINLYFLYDSIFKKKLKLLLWEEPEIGLHPHQLFELMSIVKEQSKHKQILISTHSPIVLNCLDADELDRIIICEYKKGEGTKLRQLTEKEMDKARAYMKDVGFLSDYWMHSDLQKWQKNA